METDISNAEVKEGTLLRLGMSNADLSELGNSLVKKLHVMMRVSQIYDANNVTFRRFMHENLETMNAITEKEGRLSLRMLKGDIFLNDQRLCHSVEGFTSFKYVITQWKKKRIGGVTFKGGLNERMLQEFVYTMNSLPDRRDENAANFNERMAYHKIHSIEVVPLDEIEEEDADSIFQKEDQKVVAKKVFFEALGTIKEVITQIKQKQYPDVRKLKRLVQTAVRLAMQDESILLGLTTIKNYDEYTFNHSVNVSIYSIAIGRRLGLSKKALTELGITAMLHDLGKSKVPREIVNKPDKLDDAEWNLMKKHPLMGVEIVLNLKQLGEINPRTVIGIFDHHLKMDLSGYPGLFREKEPSLFGRIIQIADVYDAMTTPRVYRKKAYSPGQAIALMLKDRETTFDPILLKIFIGQVGIFPVGSLVLLDTKEIAITYKANSDPELLDRPQVIVIHRDGEGEVKKSFVDLSEPGSAGAYKRSIVKTLDPIKYHIDIVKYFI
jgi:HD-GYP domain-containing protein (c-di-GMP phosphodiesterase class II)